MAAEFAQAWEAEQWQLAGDSWDDGWAEANSWDVDYAHEHREHCSHEHGYENCEPGKEEANGNGGKSTDFGSLTLRSLESLQELACAR